MSKTISGNDTRKLLRKALKECFPEIKFRVYKIDYGSTYVSWEDGPAAPQVDAICDLFEGERFDGYTDSTSYRTIGLDGESVWFSAGYIHTKRSFSTNYVRQVIDAVFNKYRANLEGIAKPAPEDFQHGRLRTIHVPGLDTDLGVLINSEAYKRSRVLAKPSRILQRFGECPEARARREEQGANRLLAGVNCNDKPNYRNTRR